ncbi:MAG TPA: hypothetical protein VGH28_01175 [Polyangiaceae bacterium]
MTEPSRALHVRIAQAIGPRWRPLAFVGACGLFAAALRGSPPDNDPSSLARAIGTATGGTVQPRDVRWEPSGGVLSDLVFGRFALALSSETPGGPRDVWRVRVRLTPEGHPLAVTGAHDLTQTPLGDDHALVVRGTRAAFATFAYGQEQSVTALDLAGEGTENQATTTLERLTAAITNVQQTGTTDGVGRIDVGFDAPGERVGLALDDASLAIDLGDPSGERHATLDLARGDLEREVPGMHADVARHLPKRFIFWAVDTVRAVTGPGPIAWLEEKVFALRDSLKQATFHREGSQDELATNPPQILGGGSGDDSASAWPPPAVPSIWKSTEPGEGVWKAYSPAWMRKFGPAGNPPPTFYTTFVRPDQDRPYAHVLLVAMDTRQVDLDMEAGTEDPKPLTGQHGPGRLPRDPAVLTRVVAAFNGAFKTEHGEYGMMVHKRVLLPPQPNAATVIVLADGRAGFGTWGPKPIIGGLAGIPDDDIVSFRQNLDALVDQGEVNPTKRLLWGYTLPGTTMQTERSGLCVTHAGHLMYGWGDDVSATALGKAMRAAGCNYAMHLDMNPHHTGFLFMTIHELRGHDYKSEPLTPLMEMSTDRYIEYAPKDFFYVTMRDPTPPAATGATAWTADAGTQPPPTWSPGIWTSKLGEVALTSIDPDRARYRIVAGTGEPDAKTGSQPAHEVDEADKPHVVLSLSLGVGVDGSAEGGTSRSETRRRARGLVVSGKRALPMSTDDGDAALVVHKDGALGIVASNDPSLAEPGVDATELPAILRAGTITSRASLPFSHKAAPAHAALGITHDGRIVVARGEVADAEPLARALKAAGCSIAVLLDRGDDATATLRRAGTPLPPLARDRESTLFVLAVAMKPRSFRFDAAR